MQGLLDFVKTPEGQGVLSGLFGWAANAQRGTPWNNVGRGGLSGLVGYSNALDRQQEAEESTYIKKIRQMQMEELERKRAEEEQKKVGLQQFIQQIDPIKAATRNGQGPTAANASALPDRRTTDYFALLQNGLISPTEYMTAVGPKDVKVKQFEQVRNPDGTVSIVGLTEDGKVVNTSQTPFKAPEVRDFGGFVGNIDPITGKMTKVGDKTQSPDSKASNAVAWANHSLSKERLTFDRQGGVEGVLGGKLPPGFRWNNGQAEPIPGTPQAREAVEASRNRQSAIENSQAALELIDKALKHPGRATATGLSGVLSPSNYIPGTAAQDFQAIRDQIAGGAFLQAFESLKGGGAITEVEGKKAEQAIARLQTSQSDAAFAQALKDYQDVIQRGLNRLNAGGATGSWGGGGFKILNVR